MASLQTIQKEFQAYILSQTNKMATHIQGTNSEFIEDRLAVYSDGYQIRLLDALQTNFPGVVALVGEELFDALGKEYISTFPSANFTLRYFGDRFCEFLANKFPDKQSPEIIEMARFNWYLGIATDSADAPLLQIEDLANIRQDVWPNMQIIPHPSLQLVELTTNVPGLWQAINNQENMPDVQQYKQATDWVIWRKEIQVLYRRVTEVEAWILNAFQQKKTFAEVCEGLCAIVDQEQVAQTVVNSIIKFLHDGMLSEVSF